MTRARNGSQPELDGLAVSQGGEAPNLDANYTELELRGIAEASQPHATRYCI